MSICDKLPIYFYDELDEKDILEFEKHLLECEKCRQDIKRFEKMKTLMPLRNPPPEVIEAVFNKTTRKKKNVSHKKIVKTSIVMLCAYILMSFITFPKTISAENIIKNGKKFTAAETAELEIIKNRANIVKQDKENYINGMIVPLIKNE